MIGIGGQGDLAVEMRGVTKRFGDLVANDEVDLALHVGRYTPCWVKMAPARRRSCASSTGSTRMDSGSIAVGGRAVAIASPRDAIAAGIGMVTQHFSLVHP